MKANTTRNGDLRNATRADFVEDLRLTVIELVDHRRMEPARVRQLVTETLSTRRASRTEARRFSHAEPPKDAA